CGTLQATGLNAASSVVDARTIGDEAPIHMHESHEQKWPSRIWLVRHGESAANVARREAYAAHAATIDITHRDMDLPLSPFGDRQADALGRWFAGLPAEAQPTAILASPYVRARTTAERLQRAAGLEDHDDLTFVIDERLREKEYGVLERMTNIGIQQQFP